MISNHATNMFVHLNSGHLHQKNQMHKLDPEKPDAQLGYPGLPGNSRRTHRDDDFGGNFAQGALKMKKTCISAQQGALNPLGFVVFYCAPT